MTRLASSTLVLLVTIAGCGTAASPTDAGSVDGGGGGADTGADAGSAPDTGADAAVDAGVRVPTEHRADDSQCSAPAPAGNCSFGGGGPDCSMDSECTTGTNGRCNMNIGGAAFCRCSYDTCVHDTDCPTGSTCACHGAANHADGNECIAGNCRVDADCGSNGYCSPTIGGCGSLAGYYCHTAGDLCVNDTDCTGLQACQFVSTSSRWECVERQFCP